LAILIFVVLPIVAQTAAASASAQSVPAWSPSKDIGVFVFGKNGQNPDQQLKDESECYGAAKQMTGIDPKAPLLRVRPPNRKQLNKRKLRKMLIKRRARMLRARRGVLREGLQLALLPGMLERELKPGPLRAPMRCGMQQRQANAAAQKQAAAQTSAKQQKEEEELKAAHAQGLDTFQRAFEACMDARGYSVK